MNDRNEYLEAILNHLKTAYLLSDEKAAGMLPGFCGALLTYIEDLEEKIKAGDLDEVTRAGHTVKGALLNLGLHDLANQAFSLEQLSKQGVQTNEYSRLVKEMKAQVKIFALP